MSDKLQNVQLYAFIKNYTSYIAVFVQHYDFSFIRPQPSVFTFLTEKSFSKLTFWKYIDPVIDSLTSLSFNIVVWWDLFLVYGSWAHDDYVHFD